MSTWDPAADPWGRGDPRDTTPTAQHPEHTTEGQRGELTDTTLRAWIAAGQ